uniref:C2H2-type domain-containing protein n=1 Tax=Plectus sambesii TaxID=2011161 RepID=A0A914V0V9_9BILA
MMNNDLPPPYSGTEPPPVYPGLPGLPGLKNDDSCPPYPGLHTKIGERPYRSDSVVTHATICSSLETGPRYACPHCQGQFVHRGGHGAHTCAFCGKEVLIGSYIRNRTLRSLATGLIFLLCGTAMLILFIIANAEWCFYVFTIGCVIFGIFATTRNAILLRRYRIAQPVGGQASSSSI